MSNELSFTEEAEHLQMLIQNKIAKNPSFLSYAIRGCLSGAQQAVDIAQKEAANAERAITGQSTLVCGHCATGKANDRRKNV